MATDTEIAAALRDAYSGGTLPPLRDDLASDDAARAYNIQKINTQYWTDEGRKLVGRKIGLTSPAVQAQLGVDQPDFGALFEDMQVPSGETIDVSSLIQPKAEAEVAMVLEHDLDAIDCTPDEFAGAVAFACAAIEIVDSRIDDWKITFADTVADNGSSAKFVLADERHSLSGLDLYSCGMVMEADGEVASIGAGAACLGHPLKAGAWLASALSRQGDALRAGDIILTGALGPMVTLKAGQKIKTQIGGLGSCEFSFGEASV